MLCLEPEANLCQWCNQPVLAFWMGVDDYIYWCQQCQCYGDPGIIEAATRQRIAEATKVVTDPANHLFEPKEV